MKKYDIVMVDFGETFGSEQGGFRPAVVVQNDMGNRYAPTIIVVPATTRKKAKLPTHVCAQLNGNDGRASLLLCEQVRVIDKKRVKKVVGQLNKNKWEELDRALLVSLGMA